LHKSIAEDVQKAGFTIGWSLAPGRLNINSRDVLLLRLTGINAVLSD
jgi:hypothetical protein